MSGSLDVAAAIAEFLILLMFAYAAYLAFSVRHALSVRLYRNQALGVALISVSFALISFDLFAFATSLGSLPFEFFGFMMVFFWIDTSVRATRRSDPLLRDILHWKQLRIVLWALNLIGILLLSISIAYIEIVTGEVTGNNIPDYVFFLAFIPLFVTGISGVVFLPACALRSRDMTFRRHLKWFAIFVVILLIFGAVVPFFLDTSPVQPWERLVTFVAAGYCLYRSARSLVPLNRLSEAD